MLGGSLTWASLPIIAISAIVSSFLAWMISRGIEHEKSWLAAAQRNLEMLIEARLEEYPALYSLVSDIPKAFDLSPTVALDPLSLLKKLNEWDSQYAILMTSNTSNCCYAFRHALV